MSETRDERVSRLATRFPWADHNSEKPIKEFDVFRRCGDELNLAEGHAYRLTPEDVEVVRQVVKLVNERPADPFDGIVAPDDAIVRRRS